ncbi:MAG TPA: DUF3617 family protein [Steroidobacteraceae bacterium]|nr:DUF3617 family protein [Steroidobacteraceae bacterium]
MKKGVMALLAALPWTVAALAADPPQLKEGLWSIHSRDLEMPGNRQTEFTSTLCRSHASDRETREKSQSMKECTTVKETLRANELRSESRCRIQGSIVESRSRTLFLGNATHTEVHVTYTPALNGVTHSMMVEDQKYLGACPAGAESGDLMLPNGSVQHLGRAPSRAPQP